MIAPPEVVSELLVAAIALLAITFGLLQFYPRIVVAWKPKSADIPVSQLKQYSSVRRMLNKMKWAVGTLSLSAIVGLVYLLLEAISASIGNIPLWLDLLLIVLGIILFVTAIIFIALSAVKFNIEKFSLMSEK